MPLSLKKYPVLQILRTAHGLNQATRRYLEKVKLTPAAFTCLTMIVECPAITQAEIARKTGVDPASVVGVVRSLEGARKLVQRKKSGKKFLLYPTPAGVALAAQANRDYTKLLKTLALSDESKEALTSVLSKIERTLEAYPNPG
jgi:DNA-binding MarR family transcriptional regulator